MCGSGGPGVLEVTGIGAPADRIAGFSNGIGTADLIPDIAALVLFGGIGMIDVAWGVVLAGFSEGTGVVDVTGSVASAAGCSIC
jgi:hypothetical protein